MAKIIERHDINDSLHIFKQDNSARWYARFVLFNKWYCKSTKKKVKDEAIAMAHRIFIDHEVRIETNTLVQSKRFSDVAERVITKLELQHAAKQAGKKELPAEELNAYLGTKATGRSSKSNNRPVYHDYSRALRNYHIPFFDRTYVTSINQDSITELDRWREEKLGRKPASSTLLTHNSALQLVINFPGASPLALGEPPLRGAGY